MLLSGTWIYYSDNYRRYGDNPWLLRDWQF